VLFFALVLGYAYFEGQNLLQGPDIQIDVPEEVIVSPEEKVAIQGIAERIVELRLNGRPVPVTEAGAFYEEILLAPGYNRVTLVARDKRGKETTKELQIVYTPPQTDTSSSQQSPLESVLEE